MELPKEVVEWLVALDALQVSETGPSKSARNRADGITWLCLENEASSRFESGIGTAALVQSLIREKGLSDMKLDGFRTASSPVAKLFNWNKLAPALSVLGLPLDSETKSLILAGDVDAVADILSVLHQLHGDVWPEKRISTSDSGRSNQQLLEGQSEEERVQADRDSSKTGAQMDEEIGEWQAAASGEPRQKETAGARAARNSSNGASGYANGMPQSEANHVPSSRQDAFSERELNNEAAEGLAAAYDNCSNEPGEGRDGMNAPESRRSEDSDAPPEERIDWSQLASTNGRPSSRLSEVQINAERKDAKGNVTERNGAEQSGSAGGVELLAGLVAECFSVSHEEARDQMHGDFVDWIVGGFPERGSFDSALAWLQEVENRANLIAAADVSEVLTLVSTGMGSDSCHVAVATCRALSSLAKSLPVTQCADWFQSEAGPLQGLSKCWAVHRSEQLAEGLVGLVDSFSRTGMRALFQDKLHEVLPSAAVYMDVVEALLGPLAKNHACRKAFVASGVPGDLIAYALRHLGERQKLFIAHALYQQGEWQVP
jgi:hypothetical protein